MRKISEFGQNNNILVCLSPAPSNAQIIKNAAEMADAYKSSLTALYVRTTASEKMSVSDRQRLEYHISLAQQSGANIVTVFGDDIAEQILQYARISGVRKIVIGRGNFSRKRPWSPPGLTDKLVRMADDMDIHIISGDETYGRYSEISLSFPERLIPSAADIVKTAVILILSTLTGIIFRSLSFTESNIITVYILGVLLTSLMTQSHTCSVIASLGSVLLFNFFFTEPRLTLHAYAAGYPFTFAIMLIASLITGTLATRLKENARQSTLSAFRTQILLETNQLLQKASDDTEIFRTTANQLMKLLERDIIVYSYDTGALSEGITALTVPGKKNPFSYFTEENAAQWVLKNGRRAGKGTEVMADVKGLYLPIKTSNKIYGAVGIFTDKSPLDSFENSVVLSILGECSLAIDSMHNNREKEEAAIMMQNEKTRANLLSTISHDLRTPLTSISGNASNLIYNYGNMSEENRQQVFTDIYDDSMWLINIVENLLSATKIEEGRINLRLSSELIDEVIDEALTHVNRSRNKRNIAVEIKDEILIAKIDARLIIQVIVNLLDNAIKYTPADTAVKLTAEKKNNMVCISVYDEGMGIPDADKPHIFEKFYTVNKKMSDSRRSLGLGLSLCKSIIDLHGGEISVKDNVPHGCIFTFTLPLSEVEINE